MRKNGQLLIGGGLIFSGLLIILSKLFNIDAWTICWPSAFILIGLWLIFRPKLLPPGSGVNIQPFCDIRRKGPWAVEPEEIWMFVGDVKLDLREAEIPLGETSIRINGFVGDVTLILPEQASISISASAMLNDARILGNKQDTFLNLLQYASPDYSTAERKIRLETYFFVCDLDIE